jgi:hypothetical protein
VIALRPALVDDAEAIAATHVDSWRGAYAGRVPRGMADAVTLESRVPMWRALLDAHRDTHPTLVAADEVSGDIVGFVTASPIGGPLQGLEGESAPRSGPAPVPCHGGIAGWLRLRRDDRLGAGAAGRRAILRGAGRPVSDPDRRARLRSDQSALCLA